MSDILDDLPEMTQSQCKDCGATDWTGANLHPDGGFYQCNKCHKWDEETKTLGRLQ